MGIRRAIVDRCTESLQRRLTREPTPAVHPESLDKAKKEDSDAAGVYRCACSLSPTVYPLPLSKHHSDERDHPDRPSDHDTSDDLPIRTARSALLRRRPAAGTGSARSARVGPGGGGGGSGDGVDGSGGDGGDLRRRRGKDGGGEDDGGRRGGGREERLGGGVHAGRRSGRRAARSNEREMSEGTT